MEPHKIYTSPFFICISEIVYCHVESVLFSYAFFGIAALAEAKEEENPLPVEAITKGCVKT